MTRRSLLALALRTGLVLMAPATPPATADVRTDSPGAVSPAPPTWAFADRVVTKHFVFLSNIPRAKLREYSDFCEAFLGVVDRDFMPVRGKFPVTFYVLGDEVACRSFLKDKFGQSGAAMGEAFYQENAIVTYDGSGLGTFTHEIIHLICHADIPKEEPWAVEGVASFFEKFYGYWQGENLVVKWGYQNPWRIYGLGDRLTQIKLADVLGYTYDNADGSETPQRLVSTFLFAQGKFKAYLDLARRGDHRGYPTLVEAAFGKPVSELEVPWEQFLGRIAAQRAAIYQLPLSSVSPTKEQYLALVKQYNL